MQQLPILFRQPGLVLLVGLAGGLLPDVGRANSGLDTNITANIVNSSCKVTVDNGGEMWGGDRFCMVVMWGKKGAEAMNDGGCEAR
ncbi:hypothetical protein ACUV78_003117 [Enterobacter kobei]